MILHIRLSPNRVPVVRAGFSLVLLFFIPLLCLIGANLPLPALTRTGIAIMLSVLAVALFCGATSEILYSKNRLVLVTPCGRRTYPVRLIRKINTARIPSSCFFMFTITTRFGRTRIYHMVAPTSSIGTYSITVDALTDAFKTIQVEGNSAGLRRTRPEEDK